MVQATPFRFESAATNIVRPIAVSAIAKEPDPEPIEIPNKAILNPERIKSMAEYVFGEDRVKFTKYTHSRLEETSMTLDIHFPEIHMTNSKEQEHTIRNLFARLLIRINKPDPNNMHKCSIRFHGARSEYSLEELNAHYCHSHLPGGICFPSSGDWNAFCLGVSDYSMIITNTTIHAEEEDWLSLFFGMESYLSWESLEGGPYITFSDIKQSRTQLRTVPSQELINEVERIYRRMPLHLWEYTSERFTINPNNPDVIDFFNEHSKIRKEKVITENGNPAAYYREQYKHYFYTFNKTVFRLEITDEKEKEKQEAKNDKIEPVEHAVIQKYCNILENNISLFTKKYLYASIAQGKNFADQTRILEQA